MHPSLRVPAIQVVLYVTSVRTTYVRPPIRGVVSDRTKPQRTPTAEEPKEVVGMSDSEASPGPKWFGDRFRRSTNSPLSEALPTRSASVTVKLDPPRPRMPGPSQRLGDLRGRPAGPRRRGAPGARRGPPGPCLTACAVWEISEGGYRWMRPIVDQLDRDHEQTRLRLRAREGHRLGLPRPRTGRPLRRGDPRGDVGAGRCLRRCLAPDRRARAGPPLPQCLAQRGPDAGRPHPRPGAPRAAGDQERLQQARRRRAGTAAAEGGIAAA